MGDFKLSVQPDVLCWCLCILSKIPLFLDDVKLFLKKKHKSELAKSLKAKLAFFHRNKAFKQRTAKRPIVWLNLLSWLDQVDAIYMHSSVSILKPLDAVYHPAPWCTNMATEHIIVPCARREVGRQSLTVRRTRRMLFTKHSWVNVLHMVYHMSS